MSNFYYPPVTSSITRACNFLVSEQVTADFKIEHLKQNMANFRSIMERLKKKFEEISDLVGKKKTKNEAVVQVLRTIRGYWASWSSNVSTETSSKCACLSGIPCVSLKIKIETENDNFDWATRNVAQLITNHSPSDFILSWPWKESKRSRLLECQQSYWSNLLIKAHLLKFFLEEKESFEKGRNVTET